MIRELLSQADLASAPVLALLLFFALFAALVVHAWMRVDERPSQLPLNDGTVDDVNLNSEGVPHG